MALICTLLTAGLSGCSNSAEPAPAQQNEANFMPDATDPPAVMTTYNIVATKEPFFPASTDVLLSAVADSTATPDPDMPAATDEPEITAEPTPEPTVASEYASYNYAALTDTSFGFVLDYPILWQNLPGKYTVCFEEQPTDGDFPARVAVTSKKMPHKPQRETVVEQFQLFAQQIYAQYDPDTFEFSDLTPATFMGRDGYSIEYLAYSGDIEVKGYMCCCAVDYTIYVFHFCSSYNDYEDFSPVLTRIRNSVAPVE